MGEKFELAEIGAIHQVGSQLVGHADAIRGITASPGFASCAAAMPSSAIGAACASKDSILADLLSRAAGRVEAVANCCFESGDMIIDTEEESASGFKALGEF
ncbi:hypothetical protein VX037_09460 [Gordonia sp. Z-3]|uniref:hypothetical protein n=1 Tax=Gordonia sp. Z-3 TaxID=3115408 RepID=UPI002E29F885|nr:hypothetical protein [Gordonia sp. Z-3]MED5801249.1 hypothetical protein [Gordonia sp. Z-3]